MSESLPDFEGENLASYEALRTAIRLADGFTLIFAVVNAEAGAQEVMRRLWREGVRYQKAWLRDPERPLVDQVVESARSARLPVMVLGLEGLTTMREALGRSLQNLNWTRPQWTARLPLPIVFWVTADMEADLARQAPDLWRFRSLRVEFTFGLLPRAARAAEVRKRLRTLDLAPRVRLANLTEVFRLTRTQSAIEEAVRIVANHYDLARPEEFEYLRTLLLTSHEVDDASLERIGPLPRLRHLTIFYARCSDEGLSTFINQSEPLELTGANFFSFPVGRLSLNALAGLPAVKDLRLGGMRLDHRSLEALPRMGKLKYFEALNCQLDDAMLSMICQVHGLSILAVSGRDVSDQGAAFVSALRRLWMLSLEDTSVTSRCLPQLIRLRDLRDLDLSNTAVSDDGLEILSDLPRIQRIDLQWSKVTLDAAARLRKLFADQRRKVEVLV